MLEIKGANIINGKDERIRVHMEGFGTFIAEDYRKLEEFRDMVSQAAVYNLELQDQQDIHSKMWAYYCEKATKLLKLGHMLYDVCREYREEHGYEY